MQLAFTYVGTDTTDIQSLLCTYTKLCVGFIVCHTSTDVQAKDFTVFTVTSHVLASSCALDSASYFMTL